MNQANTVKPKPTLKLTVKTLEKKTAPKEVSAECAASPVIGYT